MSIVKTVSEKALLSYAKSNIAAADAKDVFKQSRRQRGALAVEYGLILAIVITIVIVAANAMSHELESFFEAAATKITSWMGSLKLSFSF